MSYWKSKVLPKLKKLLKKGPKGQAAEACRSFNKSKDSIAKEIEENKEVLQTKVVAIYQSSSNEAKGLLKEPTESGVTEFIEVVQNLLIELSDAGCPGAQSLSDAATKHGPSAMSEPIVFLFSKLTVFVAAEDAVVASDEPTKGEPRELDITTETKQPAADTIPKSEEPALEAIPKPTMLEAAPQT
eukprot:c21331_g1_i1 orf=421-978(-)